MNEDLKLKAMIIAAIVRNEMEDFHVNHLTDEQMRELNPIIRNAIYTGLYGMKLASEGDPLAWHYIEFTRTRYIPSYWEAPELTEDFRQVTRL